MFTLKEIYKWLFFKKQKLIKCPHCGMVGGNATMPRWHFDNCKYREYAFRIIAIKLVLPNYVWFNYSYI